MKTTLNAIRRRLMGVPNPYAGYVEACAATAEHYAKLDPQDKHSAHRLHWRYETWGFKATVESHIGGVR